MAQNDNGSKWWIFILANGHQNAKFNPLQNFQLYGTTITIVIIVTMIIIAILTITIIIIIIIIKFHIITLIHVLYINTFRQLPIA